MNKRPRVSYYIPLLLTIILVAAAAPVRADDYEALFDKARQNYRKNHYSEALKLYQKANNMKGKTSLECLLGIAET